MTPEEYDQAACRGRADLKWGFHDYGGRQEVDNAACKAVCASCPVSGPCLTQVMDTEAPSLRHGIWGGLTAEERDEAYKAGRTLGGYIRYPPYRKAGTPYTASSKAQAVIRADRAARA